MLHIFVKFYVLDIEWRNRGFVPQCLDWFVSLNNVCDFLFWWAALPKESVNIVKPLQSEGSGTPSVIRRDVGIQGILGMLTCVVPKWCHLSLTSSTSYQIIPPSPTHQLIVTRMIRYRYTLHALPRIWTCCWPSLR